MSSVSRNAPRTPAIPAETDPSFQRVIKEAVEVGLGIIGDGKNRFVTVGELQDLNLAKTRIKGGKVVSVLPFPDDSSIPQKYMSQKIPPAPKNLQVVGSMNFLILTWDAPTFDYFSHTEVWRSQDANLGNASLVGTSFAPVFSDSVGTGVTRYYWVRHVSHYGKAGPYNSTTGTPGTSGSVEQDNFASSISPVGLVATLPNPVGYTGPNLIYVQDQEKVYRYIASVPAFEPAVDEIDLDALELLNGPADAGATQGAQVGTDLFDSVGALLNEVDVITSQGIASGITGQGALATKNAVDLATAEVLNKTAANVGAEPSTHRGTSAPTDTTKLWLDTSVTPSIWKYHNGAAWEALGIENQGALATLNEVTANEIANRTIVAGNIVSGTITAFEISAGTITANEIAAATIVGNLIASRTILATHIQAGEITANEMAANTITANQLAADSVVAGIIAAGAINATDLFVNDVISGDKIIASTITGDLIAADEILGSHIAANEIDGGHIKANVIDANHISVSTLSGISANLGTITAGTITLDSSGFVRGGQSGFRSGSGFWLGYNSGYKFSIGDPGGNNEFYWDGTDLWVTGKIFLRAFTPGASTIIESNGDRATQYTSVSSSMTCGPWERLKEFVVTRFGTLRVYITWSTGGSGSDNQGRVRILVNDNVRWTSGYLFGSDSTTSTVDIQVEPDDLLEIQGEACAEDDLGGYEITGTTTVNACSLRCSFEPTERVIYG